MCPTQINARYTDIRAIHMERERKCAAASTKEKWMTLGHFNWTYVENLSGILANKTEVNLEGIRRQNLAIVNRKAQEKSYCQPIYILREFDITQQGSVDSFWSKQAAFMVITRIHSRLPSQLAFEKSVDEQLGANPEIDLDAPLSNKVFTLRYRTLDLSDVVLVMKSDSVYELMHKLGKLYSTPSIGDIYSYYCIRQEELFDDPDFHLALSSDSGILASVRFAVRNAKKMNDFLSELKRLPQFEDSESHRCIFFVTGTEDINAITTNLSSAELCDIFRFIHLSLDKEPSFYDAVDDITSRIGIPEDDLNINQSDRTSVPFVNNLRTVYTDLRATLITALATESEKDWHRTILETLDSLIEMSTNSVLRPVCFILLGAINGIVDKISKKLIDCVEMEQELNEFLIGTTYVMEHILRMEGELVHHPETRPLLFDIPASILEFDLALVDRCADYFKSREHKCQDSTLLGKADNREYCFLIVPRLYTNITIHDFCNKHDDVLRLLYVEIPLSLMYNPFEVACNLVHEVAHHSGEITRHRDLRHKRLCYCCALLLAEALGVDDSKKTVNLIYQRLFLQLALELRNRDLTGRVYLRDLLPIYFNLAKKMFGNKNICLEFIREYVGDSSGDSRIPEELFDTLYGTYLETERGSCILDIRKRIEQVSSLFSECYADLAMKTLLSLSDVEYLKLLSNDFALYSQARNGNVSDDTNSTTYVYLIERVSLVLCASSNNVLQSLQATLSQQIGMESFINEIIVFCTEFTKCDERTTTNLPHNSNDDTPAMPYHSFQILDTICEYLQQCLSTMEQLDAIPENAVQKQSIANSFKTFAKEKRLASDAFLDEIGQYRDRLIKSIHLK